MIRGFSFIEVIVTVTMFTLLSLAVTSAIVQFYRSNAHAVTQAAEIQSASRSLKNVIREIRQVSFADDGAFPIIDADEYQFVFFGDIDQDGDIEHVAYVLSDTTLTREVTEPVGSPPTYPDDPDHVGTISIYVRNDEDATPLFRYFDEDGSEVNGSDLAEIASVEMSIIIDLDTNKDPAPLVLQSSATLRNLKDNL